MKKYIFAFVSLLLLAFSCKKEEKGFVNEGAPYFHIVVTDDMDIPQANLDQMSAQYTLSMGANAYSLSANANNHVSKAFRFNVKSNQRWKIVSAEDEEPSWIHPFPAYGEKEGIFFFKTDRNIDPSNSREAYFNIYIDDGSNNWQLMDGMITVSQSSSPEFLEPSAAMFNVDANEQNVKLRILANVDWEYELVPMEEYATEDVSWITDNSVHTASKQIDTLAFRVGPNSLGIRGANIKINYTANGNSVTDIIPLTQYPAAEAVLEGFPVKWVVRMPDNTFASTFPADGTIPPVSGSGLITFHNEAGKAADSAGKVLLDVSDNSPRAQGVWPGDYAEFVASSPVSRGSIVKLSFATRVSGSGQKYWRLEYRDGEQWKVAGKTSTDESVTGPDGKPVVYTHAMNADGATNILVQNTVTYTNNTDRVEFRFICAANWQANGAGALAAPNGGTWRLSVNEKSADDPYQPQISIVAAGSEVLNPANLSVAPAYLTFEGKPTGRKSFTVSSDQAFTLVPNQSWIHVNVAESDLGENLPFYVTCDNNTGETLREGSVTVKAGITRREIAIIQAGQAVAEPPYINVTTGKSINAPYTAGSVEVKIEANVNVLAESKADWISITPSKASSFPATFTVNYALNEDTNSSRTGTLRFYSNDADVETLVTVTQAKNTSAAQVYFQDNFDWLLPYADAWLKANTQYTAADLDPVGNNASSHQQPNIWSIADLASTLGKELQETRGYTDLNPAAKTLYLQYGYFKMGAGNKQTGLTLPSIAFGDTPVNVEFSFDWCAHMSAKGVIDDCPLVVELSGAGVCENSDAAKSQQFTTTQATNELAWQHATIKLIGVTSATKITMRMDYDGYAQSGNHRWHLDNLLITEVK